MSGTLTSADILEGVGDSLMAGTPTSTMSTAIASINSNFSTTTRKFTGANTGRQASATGQVGSVTALTYTPTIYFINRGVGSTIISDINVTQILSDGATAVVMESGINDITIAATPVGTFRTTCDTKLDAMIAGGISPSKIWVIGISLYGEAWKTGPDWNNAFDAGGGASPSIEDYNAQLAASCAARGVNFVPTRDALLALAVVNNPTQVINNGILTLATGGPNPHPGTALGQPCIATEFMKQVTVTPYP